MIAVLTGAGISTESGIPDFRRLAIVNADPTPHDDLAARVAREPMGEVMADVLDDLVGTAI